MSKKKTEIGIGEIPSAEQDTGEAIKAKKQGDATDEVEGHAYWENVVCPHCGGVNLILADPNTTLRYECAYGYHTFLY